MVEFYLLLAAVLFLSILLGLWRVVKGPSRADRMLAAQLFGTTGTATVLLLAKGLALPFLTPLALLFALLAIVSLVGFVSTHQRGGE